MRHRLACILATAGLVGCWLRNLSLANATVDGVKGNLDAIKNDLQKMTDAQGDLEAAFQELATSYEKTFSKIDCG